MTLWGGGERDSWPLSVHSFSFRGQLVLPGPPSVVLWTVCACVSALSRVIAVWQRAWPSLARGICRLVCVVPECPCFLAAQTSPLSSFFVLSYWLLFNNSVQMRKCQRPFKALVMFLVFFFLVMISSMQTFCPLNPPSKKKIKKNWGFLSLCWPKLVECYTGKSTLKKKNIPADILVPDINLEFFSSKILGERVLGCMFRLKSDFCAL